MGRALIHCAADYGQKDVLDYLLSQGANVNVRFRFLYFYANSKF